MPRKVQSDYVELSVARKKGSSEARLLQYLKDSEKGGGDMIMEAIIPLYLPYMLYSEGVRGEKLSSCVLDAIAQLEVQIIKMKRAFGMEGLAQVVLVQPYGSGLPTSAATTTQPHGSGVFSLIAATDIQAQAEKSASFFTGVVSTDDVSVSSEVPLVVEEQSFQEEDLDDFFNDDEDDVIAKAEIEVDPGFRLE
ncbi:hypothetical protein VF14_27420 [Nostoc linckia z18]|uniref:Uncharacterized protein n=4 Tax=Nostoc linckia TaxID=92942 RepID=A0A9Q5Z7T6_NOSLI|nr:hypothetical protein [Nostoc linckia]PHJ56235.1 hypothetical protein VF02_33660 [Nostoc linckia z1]PHJ58116.1 hypothetical protein VF05_34555 [Nostoc linckia z3]PHJ74656.1 hypothetical protein VF06_34385 [Nostoc linckia z4]PHK16701.1 hypothetical protein VF11_24060 [Nostoc linckia z14]PHK20767.1 hypothetical protein VF10_19405 [Nostoc linckia z13]PHK30561.1 hypothetical protein VF14_27420 [Nostoc linckia z18]PHK38822.1 hypothetical protein VF12_16615 [Nostoc linckia z15]PHK43492.1 hypoth